MSSRKYAILVAGGTGKRMGTETPKQFLKINGVPIILVSIRKFLEVGCRLVVVLPSQYVQTFKDLLSQFGMETDQLTMVVGGEERFDSVKNGLSTIDDENEALVAVHDAVRPFIEVTKISELFQLTEKVKAVVPVIPMKDSIRKVQGQQSETVDRTNYVLVQTPQVFELGLLKKAYSGAIPKSTTDDATLVQLAGFTPVLVEGDSNNIKITTPMDLEWADFLAKKLNIRLR